MAQPHTNGGYAFQPMRIQVRPGSKAERLYYHGAALPGQQWPMPKAIAPGIDPSPLDDLLFHGGKVVPQMEFQNVYLGGEPSWVEQDIASIDTAIELAMQDKRLNNVVSQYFPHKAIDCSMRESFILDESKPSSVDESQVHETVISLFDSGLIRKSDLDSCIFNLILPSGTSLKLDGASSLAGLGGYHGSVHIRRGKTKVTLYYSANVYSQLLANGKENGIAVFDRPWKNVVGTLYHEINEFRTDADVNDAISENNNDFLGWTSRDGKEVGDQPIFKAGEEGNLNLVFKEVQATTRKKRIPVQFLYSNVVHGAEGPIDKPHT
ncbi:hypothetical protein [Paraburkholderia sp. SIMBA_054]|uniref:hypothetical protein n=1 Tax=Paraburkholderia sp. SIMBA_054 TaxID=3085795 RepID=UPI00397D6C7B